MGLGPAASYLAKYNNYTLPGYVQDESFDSVMNMADHYASYADGSLTEYTGLHNKVLSLTLKVWEQDYLTCKNQVQQAATMLRSKKAGFAPLYVQYTDRYYEALTNSVKIDKTAGTSVRTLDYQVQFECKPWLISETTYTISGTNLNGQRVTLSTVGRTIDDGGWTPTSIRFSGNYVTISGYTQTGDSAGFVSVSGSAANWVIDSDAFTVVNNTGVNKNGSMRWFDYRTYVGPEVTYFTISGAQLCEITYHNRWYI